MHPTVCAKLPWPSGTIALLAPTLTFLAYREFDNYQRAKEKAVHVVLRQLTHTRESTQTDFA